LGFGCGFPAAAAPHAHRDRCGRGPLDHLGGVADRRRSRLQGLTRSGIRAFALLEFGHSDSIDLFLREQDVRRALEEILSDEPDWAGLFYVAPVELDERDVSTN
jgi:hypothetical protein